MHPAILRLVLTVLVAGALDSPALAQPAPQGFQDLTPDHWAYKPVMDLARRGILQGFPDARFHGEKGVDRLTLAAALARTLEQVEGFKIQGLEFQRQDLEVLLRLARELEPELKAHGIELAAVNEKITRQRIRLDRLEGKVDELSQRLDHSESFRYRSGELRVVGFNNEEIESFTNLILNYEYRVSDQISGIFSPQVFTRFDGDLSDALQIWEAYADFNRFGVLDTARIGRQLMFFGPGMTLSDRVEGFNFHSFYGDLFLQIVYTGDLMFLAEQTIFSGQNLGFYWIEEDRGPLGNRPIHVGSYLRGPLGDKLDMGIEYANYSNRFETPGNRDVYTEGLLVDVKWMPDPAYMANVTYVVQQEDFRGLAIDRDLSYHSPRYSPLEDILQAISLARRVAPLPRDKNEINGFQDLRLALESDIPMSSYRAGISVDRMTNNGNFWDNSQNAFTLWSLRLERPVTERSWIEFRLRSMDFDSPSEDQFVDTLGIPRLDRSEIRVQWFGTF